MSVLNDKLQGPKICRKHYPTIGLNVSHKHENAGLFYTRLL